MESQQVQRLRRYPGPPGRAGVTSSIRRSLGEKCALRQIPAHKSGSRKRDFVEVP